MLPFDPRSYLKLDGLMELASKVNDVEASHPASDQTEEPPAGAGGPTKSFGQLAVVHSAASAKGAAENENARASPSVASIFFRTIVWVFENYWPQYKPKRVFWNTVFRKSG